MKAHAKNTLQMIRASMVSFLKAGINTATLSGQKLWHSTITILQKKCNH